MRNFIMRLSYDGTRYKGWQRLGDTDQTIQGKLETLLSRLLEQPIEVIGSGRTDAGAHAVGQTANFHADTSLSEGELLDALRRYLPEDIGVNMLTETDERFHSRYHAREKTYCYRIWRSEQPCIFERKYVWIMREALNLDAMRQAAQLLTGTHDYRAFCSNKNFKKSSVRTVREIRLEETPTELRFYVTGDGFLYNMVRILVGTLVEIGKGERRAEELPAVLESKKRDNAGITVPPQGLCLMEVVYQ